MVKSTKAPNDDSLIPWEKGGTAYTLCKKMIENGDLTGNELPLQVHGMNDIFRSVNKKSFRAGWGRLKGKMSIFLRKSAPLSKSGKQANFAKGGHMSDDDNDEDGYSVETTTPMKDKKKAYVNGD